MMSASPCPPPPQSAAAPMPPPRRCSSRARCRAMRAPDMPRGCPTAMAPPLTLTLAGSRPSSRVEAIPTAANASLISTRSRSVGSMPSLAQALAMARAGWDWRVESGPADDAVGADFRDPGQAEFFGFGFAHHDHGGGAVGDRGGGAGGDGAVLAERGRSLPRDSVVVSARMPSSCAKTIGSPLRWGMETGTTSLSK